MIRLRVQEGHDQSKRGVVITEAILDTGSDRSYCKSSLAEWFQAKERPMPLSVNTITSGRKEMTSEEVTLTAPKLRMRKRHSITIPKVTVVKKLPSALQTAVVLVDAHEIAS